MSDWNEEKRKTLEDLKQDLRVAGGHDDEGYVAALDAVLAEAKEVKAFRTRAEKAEAELEAIKNPEPRVHGPICPCPWCLVQRYRAVLKSTNEKLTKAEAELAQMGEELQQECSKTFTLENKLAQAREEIERLKEREEIQRGMCDRRELEFEARIERLEKALEAMRVLKDSHFRNAASAQSRIERLDKDVRHWRVRAGESDGSPQEK